MKHHLRKSFLFVLFFPLLLKGQESALRFMNYTAEQGLVNNSVHSVLLDRDGFLWAGTEGGLSRFDGRTFTNYTSDPLDSNSLGGNLIVELFQDRLGLIWIAIEDGGISVFNPQTERFKRYVFNPDNPLEPGCNKPTAFIEDTQGNLWVAFWNKGMARFDRKTQSFNTFSFDKRKTGYNFNEILKVASDAKGVFWLSTRAGLVSFNPHNGTFATHQTGDVSLDLLQGVAVGKDGKIYCGTWKNGIRVYSPRENTWREFTLNADPNIEGINHSGQLCFIDTNLVLYTNRYKGFGVFNTSTEKNTKLEFDAENTMSLRSQGPGIFVRAIGNHFALGSRGGMHILLGNNRAFEQFNGAKPEASEQGSLYVVSCFFPDTLNGKIVVGTYYKKGVYVFDEREKTEEPNSLASYNNQTISVAAGLRNPFNPNEYWWGTNRGLMQIVTSTNSSEPKLEPVRFKNKPNQLIPEQSVYQLFQQGDLVWIACTKNLYEYEYAADSLYDFYPTLAKLLNDSELGILNLKPGKEGWFYGITHSRRLFRFHPIRKKANWISLSNESKALPQVINDLTIANDGSLWLLTGQTGLARLNPETSDLRFYTKKDGLNIARFVSVCADDQNRIWILSDRGVSVLNQRTGFIRNMDAAHGISLREANVIEYKDDGYIYIGALNKFIRFKPEALLASEKDRNIIVTGISIMGELLRSDMAYRSIRKIERSYKENMLALSFTIPDAFGQNDYYYFTWLEGLDKDWVPAPEARISYSGLPSGKYRLKIRAKDGMGNWCSNEHQIEVIITPPFWETIWFGTIVFVLIVAGVFIALRQRIAAIKNRALEKNKIREQMAELENQALRSQMNPHFIFNCLNSINGFIVGNNPDEASRFVTKFSRLIRLILDNSKMPFVSLEQEMAALKIYIDLEKMRFEAGFESRIEIEEQLQLTSVFVPPMIFQPFVENAIWHGLLHKENPGVLAVRLRRTNQHLTVQIEDDGIGRNASANLKSKTALKSKSYGLAITRQRIRNFNTGQNTDIADSVIIEDLTDDQNSPCGTRITLTLAIRTEP